MTSLEIWLKLQMLSKLLELQSKTGMEKVILLFVYINDTVKIKSSLVMPLSFLLTVVKLQFHHGLSALCGPLRDFVLTLQIIKVDKLDIVEEKNKNFENLPNISPCPTPWRELRL